MRPEIKKGVAAAETALVTAAVTALVSWLKTRPLKTWIQKRRAQK